MKGAAVWGTRVLQQFLAAQGQYVVLLGCPAGLSMCVSPERQQRLSVEPSMLCRIVLQGLGGVVNDQTVSEETRVALGHCIRQLKHLWKAGA